MSYFANKQQTEDWACYAMLEAVTPIPGVASIDLAAERYFRAIYL